ncbi:MAG TPA: sensor histidine kinase, partial [Nocardioides sp.]|nr:sensor histidine kinase [Nocardioides sp.]
VVAVVVALAAPENKVGWLLVGGAVAAGLGAGLTEAGVYGVVTDPGSVPGATWFAALGPAVRALGWLTLVVAVPAVFPDGRLPEGRWRWLGLLAGAAIALAVGSTLVSDVGDNRLTGHFVSPWAAPRRLDDLLGLLAVVCVVAAVAGCVAGLVVRWRRGRPETRQRISLLALAVCPPALLLPVAVFVPAVPSWTFALAIVPFPAAIGVAVLTQGLYDLRRAASRGTVWLLMTVVMIAVYAAVALTASAMAAEPGSWWPQVLAAAAATLVVVPVRDWVQRRVNRIVYGRALEPYEVLAGLGARLEGLADPGRVIADAARMIQTELDLEDVAVRRTDGTLLTGAASAHPATTTVPLRAFAGPVGSLEFRSPGRELSARERRLVDDLARPLGSAVHALALRETVEQARERLVLAREEERRRLRRDLHDGIGPTLAGLTLKVRTAATLLPRDADRAGSMLAEIGEEIRLTVTEVRRVVEGLRPPTLDELGLVDSCTQAVRSLLRDSTIALVVEEDPALPPLPAAVEVAAYRIVLEAVTNVVRHGDARNCHVRFGCADGTLTVTIEDDGIGMAEPPRTGTGLTSMSERAGELGGELTVTSGAGLTVQARLPVPRSTREPT